MRAMSETWSGISISGLAVVERRLRRIGQVAGRAGGGWPTQPGCTSPSATCYAEMATARDRVSDAGASLNQLRDETTCATAQMPDDSIAGGVCRVVPWINGRQCILADVQPVARHNVFRAGGAFSFR
jgi:hypothetical protein